MLQIVCVHLTLALANLVYGDDDNAFGMFILHNQHIPFTLIPAKFSHEYDGDLACKAKISHEYDDDLSFPT